MELTRFSGQRLACDYVRAEQSPIVELGIFRGRDRATLARGLAAQSSPVTGPAARRKARGLTATSKATP